jgi:hypothetical protein
VLESVVAMTRDLDSVEIEMSEWHCRSRTVMSRSVFRGPLSNDDYSQSQVYGDEVPRHTFFCSRTTLVHFFSSRPSYFLAVLASNTSSPRLISARSAAAVFDRLFAERYAIMDLCLGMC